MDKYIFVVLTWDGCGHCTHFKMDKKYDGLSGLEKIRNMINELDNVTIVESNKPAYNSDNNELYNILKGGVWFPSFYLFTVDEWNKVQSGIAPSGLVMGGNVVNGEVKRDGSNISVKPSAIFKWVKENTQKGSYNHLSYEHRLNNLWSS